jgi:hypothetical protein
MSNYDYGKANDSIGTLAKVGIATLLVFAALVPFVITCIFIWSLYHFFIH